MLAKEQFDFLDPEKVAEVVDEACKAKILKSVTFDRKLNQFVFEISGHLLRLQLIGSSNAYGIWEKL